MDGFPLNSLAFLGSWRETAFPRVCLADAPRVRTRLPFKNSKIQHSKFGAPAAPPYASSAPIGIAKSLSPSLAASRPL